MPSYVHPLLDLEAALKSVLEATDAPLFALSRSGELVLLNWRLQTITGFAPNRRLQAGFLEEVLAPGERDRLLDQLQEQLDGGHAEPEAVCWTFVTPDGTERPMDFAAIPYRDGAGEPVGVVYVGGRARRASGYRAPAPSAPVLPVSEQDENISSLVFSIDVDTGQVTSMNNAAPYLLGYTAADFHTDPKLLSARVLPAYHEPFEACLADARRGVARSIEVGFARRDNAVVILAMMLYPGRDRTGAVVSVEGIGRDITARKEAEQQLAESHWELQAAYDRLRAQHEELQSLEKLKSQVLANVSHELRTPMVTIRGYNELMLQGEMGRITERQRNGLEVSAKSIHRLLGLIENVIDFAKLERDRSQLAAERLDLTALIADAVSECAEALRQKQLTLSLELAPEPLTVLGARARLSQAVRNLLDNAEKFTEPSGRVKVSLERQGDEVYCTISDTGIGIPESELERIFDTFYQVDGSSTRAYPGLGIGLSIAREIVELHGGRLEVESEEGEGTSFCVVLPTADAREEALGASSPTDLPPGTALSVPALDLDPDPAEEIQDEVTQRSGTTATDKYPAIRQLYKQRGRAAISTATLPPAPEPSLDDLPEHPGDDEDGDGLITGESFIEVEATTKYISHLHIRTTPDGQPPEEVPAEPPEDPEE